MHVSQSRCWIYIKLETLIITEYYVTYSQQLDGSSLMAARVKNYTQLYNLDPQCSY